MGILFSCFQKRSKTRAPSYVSNPLCWPESGNNQRRLSYDFQQDKNTPASYQGKIESVDGIAI